LNPYLLPPGEKHVFDSLGMYKDVSLTRAADLLAYEIVAKAKGGWTYEQMALDDNKEAA
jgi:hypothetical protein